MELNLPVKTLGKSVNLFQLSNVDSVLNFGQVLQTAFKLCYYYTCSWDFFLQQCMVSLVTLTSNDIQQ